MGKVVLWGVGAGFKRVLDIFPSLPDYVDVYVDNMACETNEFKNILVQNPKVLLEMEIDRLVICSYMYENAIRNEAINKYHVKQDRIISLNNWLVFLLRTEKSFLLCPTKVVIDASTLCQLDCRDCYMRRDNNGTMGYGYLKAENFQNMIEHNHTIREVELSNSGEVFLNPELSPIIKIAAANNISLSMKNGTNFNDVSEDVLKEMVTTQAVKNIWIALDGASQSTYEIYRRKGNFEHVIANIEKLNKLKKKYNSVYPLLTWSYVLFSHNEDDVPLAKEMAKELGMDVVFNLAWDSEIEDGSWEPKNKELLKQLTGLDAFSRKEYFDKTKRNYMFGICSQMFYTPYFNWDGRLLGCIQRIGMKIFSNLTWWILLIRILIVMHCVCCWEMDRLKKIIVIHVHRAV